MSLSIMEVQTYWGTQTALNDLLPADSVYLDVQADRQTLPFAVLTQVSDVPEWPTAGNYASRLRFRIKVYTATLSDLDDVVTQIYAAFKPQSVVIAGVSFGCIRTNTVPLGERGGAYSAVVEHILFQDLPA